MCSLLRYLNRIFKRLRIAWRFKPRFYHCILKSVRIPCSCKPQFIRCTLQSGLSSARVCERAVKRLQIIIPDTHILFYFVLNNVCNNRGETTPGMPLILCCRVGWAWLARVRKRLRDSTHTSPISFTTVGVVLKNSANYFRIEAIPSLF